MKATHKEIKQNIGFQEVTLKPGQFIFGRKKCSQETGLSVQTIRTCIQKLNNQKLTIKSTNQYSIISIKNWPTYQMCDEITNQPNNQQVTSKQPANNQQVTTNKNVKNNTSTKSRSAGIFEFINPELLKRVGTRWPKCYQWIAKEIKHNKNKNAILHILNRIDQTKDIKDYYGFVTEILKVENGNYNALEFDTQEAQKQQERLKQHLDSIGEKI